MVFFLPIGWFYITESYHLFSGNVRNSIIENLSSNQPANPLPGLYRSAGQSRLPREKAGSTASCQDLWRPEHQHYLQNAGRRMKLIDIVPDSWVEHFVSTILWDDFFWATSDRGLVCLPVSASPTPWRVALTFYTTLRKASASFWCSAIWSSNQYSLDPRYNETHVYRYQTLHHAVQPKTKTTHPISCVTSHMCASAS